MSGSPRDLGAFDPWKASLERSLARRERAGRRRARRGVAARPALTTLLATGGLELPRDLADQQPWQLSLGRSRARRRAAELRFTPTSSRAKRVSLGALAAFSVAPTASLASEGASSGATASNPEPATTTEHVIVLSEGSEGRQVQLLQKALGGVKVDGVFGAETEAAVRSFQEKRGLAVDGVVGAQTSAALRTATSAASEGKVLEASFQTPVPGEAQQAQPSTEGTTYSSSSSSASPASEEAQVPTSTAGASEAGGNEPGVYAYATAPTESTAPTTPAAASSSSEASSAGSSSAGSESSASESSAHEASGQESQTHETSSQNTSEPTPAHAVARLQAALHLPADGSFGPETVAAVRRLQARHGLSVDGVVGAETWSVIGVHDEQTLTPPPSAQVKQAAPNAQETSAATHEAQPATAEQPAAKSEAPAAGGGEQSAPAPTFSGSPVERLQHALHMQVDGEFGAETVAAVRRLQARHGLPADGVVGPETWRVLGISSEGTLTPPHSALAAAEEQPQARPSGEGSGGSSSTSTAGGGEGGEASGVIARVIAAGEEIATRPYVWGGGHGSFQSTGYDCSGSVSYALHGGGLLSSPEDSSEFESYGEPGPGRDITIYANAEHVWMVVDGKRFDTVALAESGNRWSSSMASTEGYVVRHPAGY